MGSEVRELFLNDPVYGSTTKVFEWINMSGCNSMYVIVWSNSDYTTTVDYCVDSNFDIVDSEIANNTGSTSRKLILYAKTRFMRLTVSGLTPPCILRTQAFFHMESVVEKSLDDSSSTTKVDPGLQKTGYNALVSAEYVPYNQYNFGKGLSGDINAFEVPYEDISGFSSNPGNENIDIVNNTLCITGFNTPQRVYLRGLSVKYQAGFTTICRFSTRFYQGPKNVGFEGCTLQLIGMGNDTLTNTIDNALFFGYCDDTVPYSNDNFGVAWFNGGVKTFIARTAWNVDKCDGTGPSQTFINSWENMNNFEIKMKYSGNIVFCVENPLTGKFIIVHQIQVTDTSTLPNFTDPNLGFFQYQEVTPLSQPVGTTDMTCCPMFGILVEGKAPVPLERGGVFSGLLPIPGGASTLLTAIRCDSTFYGEKNHVPVRLDLLTVSCEGPKPTAVCFFYRANAVIGGSYYQPNPRIPCSVNKTGTFGGTNANTILFLVVNLEKVGRSSEDLAPLNMLLRPGEEICCTAVSANASEVSSGISYTS
jgi:hypothetical protein